VARQRIDLLLVERGLAESRAKAQALVMAGAVVVGETRVDKAGQLVDPALPIRLKEGAAPQRWVSRGALKLVGALEAFPISPAGLTCADLGASTGGFTDVLLRRGARRVFAVDVGYGQLAWSLRNDPRVVVLERENIRYLEDAKITEPPELGVCDVSFISLTLVIPRVGELLGKGGKPFLVLVKPQFEVGKGEVGKGGVVRDEDKRLAAVEKVRLCLIGAGAEVIGVETSPITGPAGNVEYLIAFRPSAGT